MSVRRGLFFMIENDVRENTIGLTWQVFLQMRKERFSL